MGGVAHRGKLLIFLLINREGGGTVYFVPEPTPEWGRLLVAHVTDIMGAHGCRLHLLCPEEPFTIFFAGSQSRDLGLAYHHPST